MFGVRGATKPSVLAACTPLEKLSYRVIFALMAVSAVILPVANVGSDPVTGKSLWTAGLLAACSLIYSVVVRSTERVRRAMADGFTPHLQGVWTFAAAVAVSNVLIPAVALVGFAAEWSYQRRSAAVELDRKIVSVLALSTSASAARLLLGPGRELLPWAALVAEVANIVLVLVIARARRGRESFTARLRSHRELRSITVDLASVAVATGAGLLAVLSGQAYALCLLAVPALVLVQHLSLLLEMAPSRTQDQATGGYHFAAWLALVGENVEFPASLMLVETRIPTIDNLRTLFELIDSRTREVIIGRTAAGFIVAQHNLRHMNGPFLARRIEELLSTHPLGADSAVEFTVAEGPADLEAAVADAEDLARQRLVARARQPGGSL